MFQWLSPRGIYYQWLRGQLGSGAESTQSQNSGAESTQRRNISVPKPEVIKPLPYRDFAQDLVVPRGRKDCRGTWEPDIGIGLREYDFSPPPPSQAENLLTTLFRDELKADINLILNKYGNDEIFGIGEIGNKHPWTKRRSINFKLVGLLGPLLSHLWTKKPFLVQKLLGVTSHQDAEAAEALIKELQNLAHNQDQARSKAFDPKGFLKNISGVILSNDRVNYTSRSLRVREVIELLREKSEQLRSAT